MFQNVQKCIYPLSFVYLGVKHKVPSKDNQKNIFYLRENVIDVCTHVFIETDRERERERETEREREREGESASKHTRVCMCVRVCVSVCVCVCVCVVCV